MGYEIIRRQSTFWDLRSDDQRVERINFIGKEEFKSAEDFVSSYEIVQQHPVLADYEFDWAMLYAARAVDDPISVEAQLKEAIESNLSPWRSPSRYLNQAGVARMLAEGSGQLIDAPEPIVDLCVAVLNAADVPFRRLSGRPSRPGFSALVADTNFVVAKSFSVVPAA